MELGYTYPCSGTRGGSFFIALFRKTYCLLLPLSRECGTVERVGQFKYLGCIVDKDDDDVHAVDNQLTKAWLKWGRFGKVLRTTGALWKVLGYFYRAVIQAVLLYGSETWTTL